MLFNSLEFILVFLPLTLVAVYLGRKYAGPRAELVVLLMASLIFYAAASGGMTYILIASILGNYGFGEILRRCRPALAKFALVSGVGANLACLVYFKYWMFLATQVPGLGALFATGDILLPTGISFYTFLQIAYLVDCFHRRTAGYGFLEYGVFVTFFPHLIAGPILHHSEMMPQFRARRSMNSRDLSIGATIFVLGLYKKLFLADKVAGFSTPVFDAAQLTPPGFTSAWLAAICYALQIYFDFSAYSDMAVGLSRMLGIRLPYNFASPYKATSIIEFWRRWHITLSRFLRDYLYIPLGGGRRGRFRTGINVFVTMVIGGVWHGAGWNFLIWGAIHGVLLMGNHLFRKVFRRIRMPSGVGWLLTFTGVIVAWVPFRAPTLEASVAIWRGMLGLNSSVATFHVDNSVPGFWMPLALFVALLLPNSQQWMRRARSGLRTPGYPSPFFVRGFWPEFPRLAWREHPLVGLGIGLVFAVCLVSLKDVSEFIYFRF